MPPCRRGLAGAPARPAGAFALILLGACSGPQSALSPAGFEAQEVARLFWAMLIGGAGIWIFVVGLAVYATRIRQGAHSEKTGGRLILWGGAVFPTVVLAALLSYGLWMMPQLRAAPGGTALTIEVTGEQFWWRVRYLAEGTQVASANEIRLPVGQKVELVLKTADVIHAFWVPSLAGKMDMIPGRTNRMVLEATKPGIYRGACTEFCGDSHALMALEAVALTPADFLGWLADAAGGAPAPEGSAEERGQALFVENGCGACHAIAGTRAAGTVGPDLTRIGERRFIAAATLPNEPEMLARFIAVPEAFKPGTKMPGYAMLSEEELSEIAAYLTSLK